MSDTATILARLRSDWEVFDAPDGERGLRRREWADVASARQEAADLIESMQTALNEANKLLEQTIEVLERSAATFNLYMKARRYEADIAADQLLDDIPPLLDNLKAREK